jgi:diadenosine tetraphosphate (Ap4A) HIT family hydrolase
VIAKRHAVEPFDLSPSEQAGFWFEVVAVARAIKQTFQPIKMNYEIHGNTLPHLHLHLLPRTPSDPFVGQPIDFESCGRRSRTDRVRSPSRHRPVGDALR